MMHLTFYASLRPRAWRVTYLAQHPSAGGPAQALAQAVEEPEAGEDGHGGRPGEQHIDASHQEQADGEEPASADLVRQHATDELTDGVGQGLAAGNHAWRQSAVAYKINRGQVEVSMPMLITTL